ncbi:MAG: class I SAM-dependent methyltransferase [Phyllobacterium sp.]
MPSNPVFEAVTSYWNRRAPLFDAAASHIRHEAEWTKVLQAAFGPGGFRDVIDLGCGTGACALIAAGLGHRVTAVDGATKMLNAARQAAIARGLAMDVVHAAIEAFEAKPASADLVTVRNVLWTMKEPGSALALARTLLRPGGKLIVSDGLWSVDPGNRSTYASDLAASLPFHRGLEQKEAEIMLRAAGFDGIQSWHHLFEDAPYPGGVPFFVLAATKPI